MDGIGTMAGSGEVILFVPSKSARIIPLPRPVEVDLDQRRGFGCRRDPSTYRLGEDDPPGPEAA
jgi:hypothetical protein